MQPGGVSEIISYFIGYLHMTEAAARDRIAYEEFLASRRVADDEGTSLPPDEPPQFDELVMASKALKVNFVSHDALHFHDLLDQAMGRAAAKFSTPVKLVKPPVQPSDDDASGGGGGGSARNAFYQDADDEVVADIDQWNWMSDNDRFSDTGRLNVENLDLGGLFGDRAEAQWALDDALSVFPADLVRGGASTAELRDWAAARTPGETPDRDSNDAAQELLPGRYLNGEKLPDESEEEATETEAASEDDTDSAGSDREATSEADKSAEEPPPLSTRPEVGEAPAYVYGEVDIAQVARTGDNTAENVAQLVDANGAAGTMIVLGDWFETNAIIQTNVYSDRDHVAQFDDDGAGGGVRTGGSVADNAAELVKSDSWTDEEIPDFKGKFIRVDVVEGDFYDVKSFTQTNWLRDQDVVVQESSTAFAMVDAGGNEQFNGMLLKEAFDYYDVIIIGGDYHSANLIYQTNVILDDDWVVVSGFGGDGEGSSIYTGQNWLFNNAKITDYGVDDPEALPAHLKDLAAQIAAGQDIVDVQAAWGLSGNGSQTLNVLYITGDYFDLNLVNQINVIVDDDLVAQTLPNGGRLGAPQYVSTGHNAAVNDATIVTAGAIDQLFVGGEHYEDSILVQANIVVGEEDENGVCVLSDLPPEIVAFTTDPTYQAPSDEPLSSPPPVHHDPMGSVMT